jgi:hypothetical protein
VQKLAAVKLKVEVFNKLTEGMTDIEISRLTGVSTTQLWRLRLPENDSRRSDPGTDFISGTLRAFPFKKFEDIFFLEEPLQACKSGVNNNLEPTGTD